MITAKTEIKRGVSAEGNEVIEMFTNANKCTPVKIVSRLYKGLQKKLIICKMEMGARTEH